MLNVVSVRDHAQATELVMWAMQQVWRLLEAATLGKAAMTWREALSVHQGRMLSAAVLHVLSC